MISINLPPYEIKTKNHEGRQQIFDFLRRRYVALTPEEWVRQHFVHFLVNHKGYPAALMANEVGIRVGQTSRRCDTVVYKKTGGTPLMIIEYKAPEVAITQKVFTQISSYNTVLRVPYLIVSNGLQHICCHIDFSTMSYRFLEDIPEYDSIVK